MGFAIHPQASLLQSRSEPITRNPAAIPAPHVTHVTHVTAPPPPPSPSPSEPVPLLRVPLRLVGVIGKLYVVLESDRGLVLLDQHAAHERILFEQMLTRLEMNDQRRPPRDCCLPKQWTFRRDATLMREHWPR